VLGTFVIDVGKEVVVEVVAHRDHDRWATASIVLRLVLRRATQCRQLTAGRRTKILAEIVLKEQRGQAALSDEEKGRASGCLEVDCLAAEA